MTQSEFYGKLEPFLNEWKNGIMQSGWNAYLHAFETAFVKEAMWRLAEVEMADGEEMNEYSRFFDEVDPKWFFDELVSRSGEDDNAARIFISDDGEAYEYFKGMMSSMRSNWNEFRKGD